MNDDDETLFSFFTELGIIAQLSSTLFERNLPDGMTRSQFSVLNWFLRVDERATPGRLAEAFQVTRGAMTNTLKKLEARGLVSVEPDPHSGRQKTVRLTPVGREVHRQALATAFPLFRAFAEEIDMGTIRRQLDDLKRIRKLLDESRYTQG